MDAVVAGTGGAATGARPAPGAGPSGPAGPVCRLDELAVGEPRRIERAGRAWCVVRTSEGVFAVDDTCSHAQASLSESFVDGTTIECWMHGATFDLRTGSVLDLPATRPIDSYPVTVTGDHVYVDTSAATGGAGE